LMLWPRSADLGREHASAPLQGPLDRDAGQLAENELLFWHDRSDVGRGQVLPFERTAADADGFACRRSAATFLRHGYSVPQIGQ